MLVNRQNRYMVFRKLPDGNLIMVESDWDDYSDNPKFGVTFNQAERFLQRIKNGKTKCSRWDQDEWDNTSEKQKIREIKKEYHYDPNAEYYILEYAWISPLNRLA